MSNKKIIDDINNYFPRDDLRNLTQINIQGNNKIYKFSIKKLNISLNIMAFLMIVMRD